MISSISTVIMSRSIIIRLIPIGMVSVSTTLLVLLSMVLLSMSMTIGLMPWSLPSILRMRSPVIIVIALRSNVAISTMLTIALIMLILMTAIFSKKIDDESGPIAVVNLVESS